MGSKSRAGSFIVVGIALCIACAPRPAPPWTAPILVVIDCSEKTTLTIQADRSVELSSPKERLHSEITIAEMEGLSGRLGSDEFFNVFKRDGYRTYPYEARCVGYSGLIMESSYTERGMKIASADDESLPAVVREVLEFSNTLHREMTGP